MNWIPLHLIQAAQSGDADAMNQIMLSFRPYIEQQSTECYSDAFGNLRYVVDTDLCHEAEIALQNAVMKFKLQEPPENFN